MIKNEYNLCKKEKTENVIIKNNLVNIRKRKKDTTAVGLEPTRVTPLT